MENHYGRWNSEGQGQTDGQIIGERLTANVNHRASGCISLIVLILFLGLILSKVAPLLF